MSQFLFLLFLFLLVTAVAAESQGNCTRSCGPHTVPYPFGFSSSCVIELNCTGGSEVSLAGFRLRNITTDTILLDVPPLCERPISVAEAFFSRNFALTRNNGFFLRNCTSSSSSPPSSGCIIATDLISARLDITSCGPPKSDNLTCFADPATGADKFVPRAEVEAIKGCKFLFSSVRYEVEDGNLTALVIAAAELGWWVEGPHCRCSANARCTRLQSPVGPAFRCTCNDGFQGTGFADAADDEPLCYAGLTPSSPPIHS